MHLTISNCDHAKPHPLRIDLGRNNSFSEAKGRVLTADRLDAHNTFEAPEIVVPEPLTDIVLKNGLIQCELPARSVVEIKIKQ